MRTPLPEGIAAPPEGFLYYGKKPLEIPASRFNEDVASWFEKLRRWDLNLRGNGTDMHYAIRAGSELAKLNGLERLTIGDWLETLPEPYRTAALKYTWQHIKRDRFTDELGSALVSAFSWELSPEGHNFWHTVTQWTRGVVATLPPFPETASEKGHPHAALMAEYAKDAAETPKPWERWEYWDIRDEAWVALDCSPLWDLKERYRRKPRTIRIGKYDVPEPVREPLPRGTDYYVVDLTADEACAEETWSDDTLDNHWLSLGLIHLTKENAILAYKALVSFTTP